MCHAEVIVDDFLLLLFDLFYWDIFYSICEVEIKILKLLYGFYLFIFPSPFSSFLSPLS
jgi:hypothetical protein